MKLYELVGTDRTQGFSPYVWRTRMALGHKALPVEMVPLIFTEIPKLDFCTAKTVPILEHDGNYITDSWDIACYLEDNFPDRPSLFGGAAGKAYASFFHFSSFYTLVIPLFQALAYDIFTCLDDRDREYFRRSREARLGKSLEAAHDRQSENLAIFHKQLWPCNSILKAQDFLSGDHPAYVDYILYGLFQWARGVSSVTLVNADEPLYHWVRRMDNLFGGLGKVIRPRG
ncbi:MAG: glutathione S-transferase family protein [Alphaproteobacteria bacterium]|nr:glutathione S-transferase family protein [Alphaproteobacteria bacterium]